MRVPKISSKIHGVSQVKMTKHPPPKKTAMAKNLQTYVSCFVKAILGYGFSLPFLVLACLVFGVLLSARFLQLEWDLFAWKYQTFWYVLMDICQNSIFQQNHAMFHDSYHHIKPFAVASSGGVCYDDLQRDYTKTGRFCIHYMPNSLSLLSSISIYLNRNIHVNCEIHLPARKASSSRPTAKEYIYN